MPAPPRPRHPLAGDPPGARARAAGPAHRAAGSGLQALSHLMPRDLQLAEWLDQHGVLTTGQIATALFDDRSTANHRLLKLLDLGLLDRFRQPLPGGGATAWHWVLGPLGAQLTAAARGDAPPSPQQLYQRQLRLAASPALGHRLGTNGFFVALYAHARRHPGELLRWWSERDTARRYAGRIHPDGHGLWCHTGRVCGFFLEHDTGTENHNRLVRKLEAYRQLAADGGPRYPVLYWLHSRRREANLQAALAQRGSPVVAATAVRGPGVTPAGPVWWLAGAAERTALHLLPCDHGDPDSMFTPNLQDPELDGLL